MEDLEILAQTPLGIYATRDGNIYGVCCYGFGCSLSGPRALKLEDGFRYFVIDEVDGGLIGGHQETGDPIVLILPIRTPQINLDNISVLGRKPNIEKYFGLDAIAGVYDRFDLGLPESFSVSKGTDDKLIQQIYDLLPQYQVLKDGFFSNINMNNLLKRLNISVPIEGGKITE